MTIFSAAGSSRPKVGRAIFKEAYKTLQKDPKIMTIPVIAVGVDAVFAVIAGISWLLLIPFMDINNATNAVNIVIGVIMAVLFGITHVVSQAAVMFAANERFEGRAPTIGGSFGAAGKKFGPLALFGLLEATFGLLLRYIADNVKVLGDVVRFIAGLTWAIATYFAIPFILFGGQNPIAAIGLSGKLIKAKWGDVMRGNVVASAVIILAWLVAFGGLVGGIFLTMSNCNGPTCNINPSGLALIGFSILVMLLTALISSTIMSYVKIALYRFATGKPLPDFDSQLLADSFRVRA